MYLPSAWSGTRLRSVVTLVLGALLGLFFLIPDVANLRGGDAAGLRAAAAVCWFLLLAWTVVLLVAGRFRVAAWGEAAAPLILIVGSGQAYFRLFGDWSGEVAVLTWVVFFVLVARNVIRQHPTRYAVVTVLVVMIVVALELADAEENVPNAQIKDAGDALYWVGAQIFRFGSLVDIRPVGDNGVFLGNLAIITGVLFTAVVFSAITAWAVGSGFESRADSTARVVRKAVRSALTEAGLLHDEEQGAEPGPRLVIDVDRVVGSRPSTWWEPRAAAVADYVRTAADNAAIRDVAGTLKREPVLLVARGSFGEGHPEPDVTGHIAVVAIDGDVCDWLESNVRADDVVVTGGKACIETIEEAGARLLPIDDFTSGRPVGDASGT